jgi:hypothetical protein
MKRAFAAAIILAMLLSVLTGLQPLNHVSDLAEQGKPENRASSPSVSDSKKMLKPKN